MLIPVIINPDDDELYYSWLLRLAEANGFDEVRHFFTAYLYRTEEFRYIYPDYLSTNFHMLWQSLPECNDDEMTFYRRLSVFDGISPLFNLSRCQRFINDVFGESKWLDEISPRLNPISQYINICPECAKEELDSKGYFYFHRIHQMPGITVCPKHHCALGKITAKRKVNLHEVPVPDMYEQATDAKIKVAMFAENLLKSNTGLSLDEVFSLIDNRMCKPHGETAEDKFNAFLSNSMSQLANKEKLKQIFKLNGGTGRIYPDPATLLIILASLFDADSPSTWKLEREEKRRTEEKSFVMFAKSSGYELVGEYHSNLVTLRHTECDTSFVVTPDGFLHGWKCPTCMSRLTSEQVFMELFKAQSLGEYELISKFDGMNNKMTIRHNICGREYEVIARRFIYENAKCTCEKELTQEKVRDRIKELTGDEYELVSYNPAKHKARIKHCTCGRTKSYKIYHFFDGHRCDCSVYIPSDEAIANYIKEYSCGRYEITKKIARYVYAVHDNESGNDIVISRKKIIAELTRPTLSKLLPLTQKNETVTLEKSDIEMMFDYLNQHYQINEPVFSEDVTLFDNNEKNRETLANLSKAGKLNHIATGIYCLPSKKGVSADDIVYNRYILRKGKRIGYYRCASMAYELGLEHKPNDYSVVTNMESSKTPQRKIHIGTIAIHIKGRDEQIDEQNWLVLATFDFLLAYKQYTNASTRRVMSALAKYIIANNEGKPLSPEAFDELVSRCKARNIKTYIKGVLGLLYKAEVSI
ncbi:MAG: TniQ family protein [Prevotella sp.]|jgi:hypothetical protein|nr:TniQ family protein [Prevotella sp.]MCH4183418.1 TniQ family protein [Prevotella sp.]